MKKSLGATLILLSVALLLFTYYPLLVLYFSPAPAVTTTTNKDYISIKKINAYSPIIANVDPWNEKSYREPLKKGVAKAKNSNFYFAHSSLPPWEMTRTNTAFLRLNELNFGDQITISENNQTKHYFVTKKIEVWPNDIKALETNPLEIILQTCAPPGTDLKRLLIFAQLSN